jgi:hypothetical protein
LLRAGANTLNTVDPVLRLTLLTSAIASGTFVATLAFAPATINVGQLLGFGQPEIAREISAPAAVRENRECGPMAKIVAALQQRQCVP